MSPELDLLSSNRQENPKSWPKVVIYGSPGGFCAGVERSVDAYRDFVAAHSEEEIYSVGVPAHNPHVVNEFKRNVKFVDNIEEVPEGSNVMFGPHGHTDEDLKTAQDKRMTYLPTECPLVTKVKSEVAVNTEEGLFTIYYGQLDEEGEYHPETRAALSSGDAILVTSLEEALSDEIAEQIPDHTKVAFASQTTHNADHVFEMEEELEKKYPGIKFPKKGDTCYATKDRQDAAKAVKKEIMVVVGDEVTSSNTRSLARVAIERGSSVKIVNNRRELSKEDFYGFDTVGVVASASAPDIQIKRVLDYFTSRGSTQEVVEVADESNIHFKPPKEHKPFEPEIIWISE